MLAHLSTTLSLRHTLCFSSGPSQMRCLEPIPDTRAQFSHITYVGLHARPIARRGSHARDMRRNYYSFSFSLFCIRYMYVPWYQGTRAGFRSLGLRSPGEVDLDCGRTPQDLDPARPSWPRTPQDLDPARPSWARTPQDLDLARPVETQPAMRMCPRHTSSHCDWDAEVNGRGAASRQARVGGPGPPLPLRLRG